MDSLTALQSQNTLQAIVALSAAPNCGPDEFEYVAVMGNLHLVCHVREWDYTVERVYCKDVNILDAMSSEAIDALGEAARECREATACYEVAE